MREKTIESKLKKAVNKNGGLCLKFISPSLTGIPDRMILMPGGKIAFAETKAPGEKMRRLQQTRKHQLEMLGFKVFLVDDADEIGVIIDEILSA